MDPRAHHQAIARTVRLRRRGRARAAPVDTRLPPRSVLILPIEPTTPQAEVLSAVGAALERATHAIVCVTCDRRLCRPNRGDRPQALFKNGEPMLTEEDWCRWCARPISERGERLAPSEGFLRLVLEAAQRAPAEPIAPREAQA